jgi:radical SAM superfamily enzyme
MSNLLNQILVATAVIGLISATRDCFDDEVIE